MLIQTLLQDPVKAGGPPRDGGDEDGSAIADNAAGFAKSPDPIGPFAQVIHGSKEEDGIDRRVIKVQAPGVAGSGADQRVARPL